MLLRCGERGSADRYTLDFRRWFFFFCISHCYALFTHVDRLLLCHARRAAAAMLQRRLLMFLRACYARRPRDMLLAMLPECAPAP